jgi:hypothetical protein
MDINAIFFFFLLNTYTLVGYVKVLFIGQQQKSHINMGNLLVSLGALFMQEICAYYMPTSMLSTGDRKVHRDSTYL